MISKEREMQQFGRLHSTIEKLFCVTVCVQNPIKIIVVNKGINIEIFKYPSK